jgi:hypothetical protein
MEEVEAELPRRLQLQAELIKVRMQDAISPQGQSASHGVLEQLVAQPAGYLKQSHRLQPEALQKIPFKTR